MKKRILSGILAAVFALSAAVGLSSCEIADPLDGAEAGGNVGLHDFCAQSIVGGVAYLAGGSDLAASGSYAAAVSATARPEIVTDGDIKAAEACLTLFGDIISGGGVNRQIVEGDWGDPILDKYKAKMTVTFGNPFEGAEPYEFYYTESGQSFTQALPDGTTKPGNKTNIDGVVVYRGEMFVVKCVRDTSGNMSNGSYGYPPAGTPDNFLPGVNVGDPDGDFSDTEKYPGTNGFVDLTSKLTPTADASAAEKSDLEFIIYKSVGTNSDNPDRSNYLKIEKELEGGEFEFEYTFVRDGVTVSEIELEYEMKDEGIEVSYESESTGDEISVEVRSSGISGSYNVLFEKNGSLENATVTDIGGGKYKIKYSNGFEEIVNNS